MADDTKKRGLGRGLGALFGDEDAVKPVPVDPPPAPASVPGAAAETGAAPGAPAARASGVRDLPVEFLKPNPDQPRREFAEEDLGDLARSIKERGVIQPIIVRPIGEKPNEYQIVAGERRWRAAQRAQRHTVPVIVKELTDSETLEIALIENIQRADLNPMEESAGYSRLMQNFGYTQDQLSKVMGKSRSHVANMLRLLSLPMTVRTMVGDGKLSAGHARAIVGADDPIAVAQDVVAKGLTVRQTEALMKRQGMPPPPPGGATGPGNALGKVRKALSPSEKDADTIALERNVSNALGLSVSVEHSGPSGGSVVIEYKTLEQLDDVCRRLAQSV
jgi:ParB family chromosome partitioning protein